MGSHSCPQSSCGLADISDVNQHARSEVTAILSIRHVSHHDCSHSRCSAVSRYTTQLFLFAQDSTTNATVGVTIKQSKGVAVCASIPIFHMLLGLIIISVDSPSPPALSPGAILRLPRVSSPSRYQSRGELLLGHMPSS